MAFIQNQSSGQSVNNRKFNLDIITRKNTQGLNVNRHNNILTKVKGGTFNLCGNRVLNITVNSENNSAKHLLQ